MSDWNRRAKIESFGQAYARLQAALRDFPREMWHYRPDAQDWTIHEILIHLADSEANGYVRCRRLIAEPGSDILAYDESAWATRLRYGEQSTAGALELFRLLRQMTYDLIRDLPDEAWEASVYHSEEGRVTFDDWLDLYERHVPLHIAQMRAVYQTWRLDNEGE